MTPELHELHDSPASPEERSAPGARAPSDAPRSIASGAGQALGRRARKALQTRNAMFAAGLAAFENRPIAVVSVLDITEASDVAKGVFYLHFRGKDEYLIALWEAVQRTFLDGVRQRASACRSRRARIAAVLEHYHAMILAAPRESRFWLRMSSYFGDEIGRPEQMSRLRQEYLHQLAALIAGVTLDEAGHEELRRAALVDGCSWGLISQAIQHGDEILDRAAFVRAVGGALHAFERAR